MLIGSCHSADTPRIIRRIEESSAITLRPHTQLEALEGDGRLQRVCWRSAHAADREVRDIRHAFSMTGADANTRWLGGCLALDEQRFVKTGADLGPEELEAAQWPLKRRPYQFETTLPRVFAVGDVRSGSMKRVASAVGEGSAASSSSTGFWPSDRERNPVVHS